MNGAKFTPGPIDWHERPPFITSISGFDTYEVNIKVHSLEELHAAHELVLKAFSDARLIAELVAALKAVADLRGWNETAPISATGIQVMQAIDKAEGRRS